MSHIENTDRPPPGEGQAPQRGSSACRLSLAIVAVVGLFAAPGGVEGLLAAPGDGEALKCPVSGKKIAKTVSFPILGKTVYFADEKSKKTFQAGPEPYLPQAYLQLLHTGQMVQVRCPIEGAPLEPDYVIQHSGFKFGFCCEKCYNKVKGAPEEKKLALIFERPKVGFTLQTTCPVSGKRISPGHRLKVKERSVYFADAESRKQFERNPAAYWKKLGPDFPQASPKAKEPKPDLPRSSPAARRTGSMPRLAVVQGWTGARPRHWPARP